MAGKILCHSLQGLRTKAEFTITSYQTARPNRGPNFKDPRSEKFFSGHGHFSCITHYSSLLCKIRSRNDVKAEEWSSNNNLERNVMHNFSTGRITNRLLFKLRQITLKFWDTYRTASLNGKKWRLKIFELLSNMASTSVNSACYGHQTTKFYVFFSGIVVRRNSLGFVKWRPLLMMMMMMMMMMNEIGDSLREGKPSR